MTPEDVAWLTTAEGAAAVEDAGAALDAGATMLAVLERLRARLDPARARAVLVLLEGRRAASRKFADAQRLFFDRESAEQATAEAVSRHIARRFEGATRIADLGAGAGADTLELAREAPVVAVERDAGRLALLRANAAVRGLEERVSVVEGEIESSSLPVDVDAAWIDPARRDERGRVRDPRLWSPPLEVALSLARAVPRAGIKVAPGIDYEHLPADAEIEFISLEGDLGVAVIWLGAAVTASRRATVLPAGATLAANGTEEAASELGEPAAYLYDPDPAIGRARLVGQLAQELEARQLDSSIAYLTSAVPRETPFARRFRIARALPFAERSLVTALRELGAGRVEVMRRGSPVDTNALERRLNRVLEGGTRVLTVALTRVAGTHTAIICERDR